MTFLDGAWSIITLPVGRSWEFGSALTMPFGKRGVRKALKKPRARPSSTLRALKWLTNPENAALMLERGEGGENATSCRYPWPDPGGRVHSAAIQDRERAKLVIQKARWFGWLRVIFADAAYSGQLVTWVHEFFGRQGTRLSIVPRLGHGFRLLAKRWIVERTFSWLTHSRRLVITEKSTSARVRMAHNLMCGCRLNRPRRLSLEELGIERQLKVRRNASRSR